MKLDHMMYKTTTLFAALCMGISCVYALPTPQPIPLPDRTNTVTKPGAAFKHQYLRTNLFSTVIDGDLEGVKYFIEQEHVPADTTDDDGTSLLMFAADAGHLPIVKYLVGEDGYIKGTKIKAAQINHRNKNGITALMTAAVHGYTAIVSHLARPETVNTRNSDGYTALMYASYSGHFDTVKILLTTPGIVLNAQANNGFTALIFAAQQGHTHIVKALVNDPRTGKYINHPTDTGATALTMAIMNGHVDVVKVLLQAPNTDVNKPNEKENGYTPLIYAVAQKHTEVVQTLVDDPRIDVNYISDDDFTALDIAVQQQDVATVKALLTHPKINVNRTNNDGVTALAVAVQLENFEIVKALLNQGNAQTDIKIPATLETEDGALIDDKVTALMAAASDGNLEIVKALVEKGAKIDIVSDSGFTALDIAEAMGNTEIADYLRAQLEKAKKK